MDTAISRIIRATITGIVDITIIFLIPCMAFPRRESMRCPAIMFAVSRTDRVIGRIMFLIISMITMKGRSAEGVPVGTMWANIILGDFIHPNNMRDNQKVRARGKFNIMCLVGVNRYGNNPEKLMTIIIRSAGIICIFTAVFLLGLVVSLASLEMVLENKLVISTLFGVVLKKCFGISRGVNRSNQFILNMDVEGSKIENRLFIMFIFCFLRV